MFFVLFVVVFKVLALILRLLSHSEPIGECSSLPMMDSTIPVAVTPPLSPAIDIDQVTESNHDTALTIASAGGHDELVQLLLARGSNIEHRDKKGRTGFIIVH